jgi:hypothetical protein
MSNSEMTSVALLTPTYARDLALCTLLCESVDRHVASFGKHYLLVPDSDYDLFSRFISDWRTVIPASAFLPSWLKPMPGMFRRKRRQFWWSMRAKPVSGWHVQQLLKIAAAVSLPHERFCILDSDIVFFRDFDLASYEAPNTIPLFRVTNEVTVEQPHHSRWVETSHQLLGLKAPPLPAPDYIGHIIFWDRNTARAMVSQIERTAGRGWVEALCRTRDFSEYMLYGYFAENERAFAAAHKPVSSTPCVSYWEAPRLDKAGLNRLLSRASRVDVAFSVASFSLTPVDVIRAAIMENEAALRPLVPSAENAGLAAAC